MRGFDIPLLTLYLLGVAAAAILALAG